MAVVQFGPDTAEILDKKWTSPNQHLADMLNTMVDAPSPVRYVPGNIDNDIAERAAEELEGTILHLEPELNRFDPKMIY